MVQTSSSSRTASLNLSIYNICAARAQSKKLLTDIIRKT